ncbi:MAG: tetratricopeptide repeat protein, partial [Bacteroidia bacterium]|nr:tetratricopeptide repeat protein [Bacteroidia bacterium]
MIFNLKAYYILIGFFFLISSAFTQDQKVADSLYIIYQKNDFQGEDRMQLLLKLGLNEMNDLNAGLKYSEELITLATLSNNYFYVFEGYVIKGNTYRQLGDIDKALEALFKASEASIKAENLEGEAISYISIADVYSEIGNPSNAELYYEKGIDISRKLDEPITLASALFNAGDEYFNNKKFDKALNYFAEAKSIFEAEDYRIGLAYALGNIGMVHAEQGNHTLAENEINQAIKILEELKDYYAIAEYLTYMSDIYIEQNDWETAISYAEQSLELAENNGLKKQISESNLKLSELHEHKGNFELSNQYFKEHIIYRDSIINLENIEKAADLRTDYEVSQKQIEVDLYKEKERNQRIIAISTAIALILIGLLAVGLYRRNKYVNRTNKIIATEKERSENLLLNILPEETAQELKEHGKVKAKKFESITVLFTDFKGFTEYAEKLTPEELVESVDFYFSKFDAIMEKHGLEKIKTVGDAYMCAGGLNNTVKNHAEKMVMAAFDIAEFVKSAKTRKSNSNTRFDIRIGINTGPVVAGVVGTKKFAYDIWGDSVNIASRMESCSEPGKINISENTYTLVKNTFNCEYRG